MERIPILKKVVYRLVTPTTGIEKQHGDYISIYDHNGDPFESDDFTTAQEIREELIEEGGPADEEFTPNDCLICEIVENHTIIKVED